MGYYKTGEMVQQNIYCTVFSKITYSLGQNIADKSTKVSNIGFSVECFTTNVLQICSTTAKICSLGNRLSTF